MSDGLTRREAATLVTVVPAVAPAMLKVSAANDPVVFSVIGAGTWGVSNCSLI